MKNQLMSILFIVIMFLMFSIISLNLVQSREFNISTKEIELSLNISSTLQSNAEKIIVNLSLFPKETELQQTIINTVPEAKLTEQFILFNFSEKGYLNYFVETQVKNKFLFKEVKNVTLPLTVPPELSPYIESSEYVTIGPYIDNKAHQLATRDAIETLYNLAEYVRKNLNYSTNYQELKNASWIMENKQGVCSHYTILFMALARSLGIPSRFVSGVAYSNKDKMLREHAWAEVWLNGEWIPYDVTFGQYGWLDASHIVMKRSIDAGTSSVEYYYTGNITIGNLSINSEITKKEGKETRPIELKAFAYRETSGFYSYIPLEITAKNPYDYYIALPIRLTIAPGVFGETEKIILLKPKSENKIFFIINVPELEECERDCIAKLAVEDAFNNKAETTILIARDKPRLSLQEAEAIIRAYGKKESQIDFYCKSDKEFYYDYENISIICQAKSPKDVQLSICNQNICKNISLISNQLEEITLEVPAKRNDSIDTVQMQCFILCIITREKRDVLATSCIDLTLLTTPKIEIATIQNSNANYGDKGDLKFIIESNVNIDAKFYLHTKNYNKTEIIFIKNGTNVMPFPIETWKLNIGENPILAKIYYKDKNNKSYEAQKEFIFTVNDVNTFKKFFVKITHLFD